MNPFVVILLAGSSLLRHRTRTILTIVGCAMAVLTFVLLRTVVGAYTAGADYASKDRLGTRHKVSFILPLPKKYLDDVRDVPGVKRAAAASWMGARDPNRPNEFFANFAVDPKDYAEVIDEMVLPKDAYERWLDDRQSAVVGDVLAKKMGWKVGDKVVLEGTIYPGDWEFHIAGIYTAARRSLDRSQFLFHWSYLNESLPAARKDHYGWIMVRIDDPAKSNDIARAIDNVFDERDTQTTTMSERAMNLSFLGMFTSILQALDVVSVLILLIMTMILGNTIAMAVRERTREYGTLRAMGFQPSHVRMFIVAEATVIGLLAGALGLLLSYPIVEKGVGAWIEENMGSFLPYVRISATTAVTAVVLATGLSVLASLVPASRAARLSVTDALRRLA